MSLRSLALLACCVLLAACNKVNQENFSRLKPGMSRVEVEQLLGAPAECAGALGFSSCTWGDERSFISIQFGNDKVLVFSGAGLK
ncbi:outer membrane protein assembly factor BamE domain-containing protein [Geopseudomonas guangdongensis]|uniref:Beta-barrel assembly machine subunit BamE n=1 Tax=Geopseudomonas guangdongensis TaxID=1245526 RepID=A0A1H2EBP7_9GAMM|nr:outer membrane protein assembly factor BamE [Pseudomonas guangdongensis]MBP9956620.1 outer membrane protein assembly factor BamE [Pseudomonas sp.]SDT92545.1 Beta-barrel assembly machine subunit BamE [Pseudomonas guangdongensis]